MKVVSGIFTSREDAGCATENLVAAGISRERISALVPGASEADLQSVPTDEGEQPGMGKTLGAIIGGAAGASLGMSIAPIVATLTLPGIGPVLAIGALGAALFAVGGAVAGGAIEEELSEGLPVDELPVYEDALRRGRSVIFALVENETEAEKVRRVMDRSGLVAIDPAREDRTIGLGDAGGMAVRGVHKETAKSP